VGPDSLNPDSDPAFSSESGSGSNTDPGISSPKTEEKNTAEIFFSYCKNYNLLMSKLQEKPSALKRGHPALQKIKLFTF
jgi:hypothetical protein